MEAPMMDETEVAQVEHSDDQTVDEVLQEEEVDSDQSDNKSPNITEDAGKESDEENDDSSLTDRVEFKLGGDSLDASSRQHLFEQAQLFHSEGELTLALQCYLQCLKGLEETNGFTFLPQCLRKVADIYFKREEYEKAVQFVQAEKMYYETAIIDTSEMQKKLAKYDEQKDDDEDTSLPAMTTDLLRADEYENLAKMCLDKNQPRLSLEYQGKATKLRQQILGDEHPLTRQSLDFFTGIYGAVGKQQYSESMQRIDSSDEASSGDTSTFQQNEGLRRRRPVNECGSQQPSAEADNTERVVTQADDDSTDLGPSLEIQEQEEWVSKVLLWILFFICIIAVSAILFYLYCKVDTSSPSCRAWRADLHYYYMRIKYLFYYYFSPDKMLG